MNMDVNLIHASEQRGASLFSLKFAGHILSVLIPGVLLLAIILNANAYRVLRSEQRLLDTLWQSAEIKQQQALDIERQLREHRALWAELQGWRRARVEWHELLAALRNLVPEAMQLRTLNVQQSLVLDDKHPARKLTLRLDGRCEGRDAELLITALPQQLQNEEPFAASVERVAVAGFREDTAPAAGPFDRVFQLDVYFLPRGFNETAR